MTNARTEFHRRHLHRNGRRGAPYLVGMEEILAFVQWLEEDVQSALAKGMVVSEDVEDSSKFPTL